MTQIRNALTVVTGASSGIGAAIARRMADEGARVVLVARTLSKLNAVADEIRSSGGDARVYACDLTQAQDVARTVQRIVDDCGVPDILVNNAGSGRWLSIEETEPTEAVSMMHAPYFAAFFVTRGWLGAMRARGSGHIVNINSPMSCVVRTSCRRPQSTSS